MEVLQCQMKSLQEHEGSCARKRAAKRAEDSKCSYHKSFHYIGKKLVFTKCISIKLWNLTLALLPPLS